MPGEFHKQRSLAGYSPRCRRVHMTERLTLTFIHSFKSYYRPSTPQNTSLFPSLFPSLHSSSFHPPTSLSLSLSLSIYIYIYIYQFSSVAQSCPTVCDPMNHSTPGLPVHHQLPEFIQTHVHRVSDAIQPSHPLSSSSPPAPNPSQHQSLFHTHTHIHTHTYMYTHTHVCVS